MRSPCCLCVSLINFWRVNQSLWHLSISQWRNLEIPPISLCVHICIPLSLLGNGSIKTLPPRRIHTKEDKNYLTRRFVCGPCLVRESKWLILPIACRYCILSSLTSRLTMLNALVLTWLAKPASHFHILYLTCASIPIMWTFWSYA
jgi:hypothetical protein